MVDAVWLLGEFDLIVGAQAWRCCGIATETTGALREYNSKGQTPYVITPVTHDKLITGPGHDINIWTCPSSGKDFVRAYSDGSLVNGNSLLESTCLMGDMGGT